jgi:hypothetical protein
MCRNIKPLFNFDPPAGEADARAAALQYVRKVSGYTKPSKANEAVFNDAVERIAAATSDLLDGLVTQAPARSREQQIARDRERAQRRWMPTHLQDG